MSTGSVWGTEFEDSERGLELLGSAPLNRRSNFGDLKWLRYMGIQGVYDPVMMKCLILLDGRSVRRCSW